MLNFIDQVNMSLPLDVNSQGLWPGVWSVLLVGNLFAAEY